MIKEIIELLYPTRCPVCDGPVAFGEDGICFECLKKLSFITPPWCLKCGKKLEDEREYCEDCLKKRHYFERGRSLYEYSCIAPAIYRFKYKGRREYAEFFGRQMSKYLSDFIRNTKAEGIVPVPLHKKRLKSRGYNQAALLARIVGDCTGIPVYENLLERVKNTKPLKTQNPEERQNNLKKAFIIRENVVKLNTIIIIDDIYTTGATIDEISRVFKEWGAKKVYFLTISCGVGV